MVSVQPPTESIGRVIVTFDPARCISSALTGSAQDELDNILIDDVAVIPIVHRASDNYAIGNTLRDENLMVSPGFEENYWNIANWNRTAES